MATAAPDAMLPDLAVECILKNLPGNSRVRCERVCRQWRRIALSMWRRLREIDICEIGGLADCRLMFPRWNSDQQLQQTIKAEFNRSNLLIDFLLKRGGDGVVDFDRISKLTIKHFVVVIEKMLELVLQCQHLQLLFVIDVICVDQKNKLLCSYRQTEIPLPDSSLANFCGIALSNTNARIDAKHLSERAHNRLQVFSGKFSHIDYFAMPRLMFNNAATLRAFEINLSLKHFINFCQTSFVGHQCNTSLFPLLRWLSLDFRSDASFERVQWFLGMMPTGLSSLLVTVLFTENAIEVARAIGECRQIEQLRSLYFRFPYSYNSDGYSTLSSLLSGRRERVGLTPMRLFVDWRGSLCEAFLAWKVIALDRFMAECQKANVVLMEMPAEQWPSIDKAVSFKPESIC